jgi:hypothetical protein
LTRTRLKALLQAASLLELSTKPIENKMLQFTRHSKAGSQPVAYASTQLVIAGWAARDEAAVKHHIEELAEIGVPPPSSVPLFYRTAASLLTQSERMEVLGPDSSGEVEPVIVSMDDGLWLTIGSDHTDRKAEAQGVALSKQLCGKPVGRDLWRLDEVAAHWDELQMRSFATIDGRRHLYQEGKLAALRPPMDLIQRYVQSRDLAPGIVMFGGLFHSLLLQKRVMTSSGFKSEKIRWLQSACQKTAI